MADFALEICSCDVLIKTSKWHLYKLLPAESISAVSIPNGKMLQGAERENTQNYSAYSACCYKQPLHLTLLHSTFDKLFVLIQCFMIIRGIWLHSKVRYPSAFFNAVLQCCVIIELSIACWAFTRQ